MAPLLRNSRVLLYVVTGQSHGQDSVGDNNQAKKLFLLSDFDNNTVLTVDEFDHVFRDFDNNKGLELFLNLDVNKDFVIDPQDVAFIFSWFDTDYFYNQLFRIRVQSKGTQVSDRKLDKVTKLLTVLLFLKSAVNWHFKRYEVAIC
ncbi:hypothetical protein MAR_032905 [Mya arenaria]|uniref:EF-hand domain-containing protein n=1 Tax=Mya arenaria TaxID=6604 RepID=A0ABY7G7G6_MYAAR|nr:hypothetical protein MAR_032905 [Mya arenaria]